MLKASLLFACSLLLWVLVYLTLFIAPVALLVGALLAVLLAQQVAAFRRPAG